MHKSIFPSPRVLVIELTSLCNLKCVYCYAYDYLDRIINSNKNISLPFKLITNLLDKPRKLGVKLIVLSGGEPTLYKYQKYNISDILELIKDMNLAAVMLTNGVLDEKHMKVILKYWKKPLVEVRVSYDGAVQSITRPPSSSEKVIYWIDKMRHNGIKVTINSALTKPLLKFIEKSYIEIMVQRKLTWRIDIPFILSLIHI